jgi:hypothetical protein
MRVTCTLVALLVILVIAGCAADVGAEVPADSSSIDAVYPTSTPRPYFGPPPVTAAPVGEPVSTLRSVQCQAGEGGGRGEVRCVRGVPDTPFQPAVVP